MTTRVLAPQTCALPLSYKGIVGIVSWSYNQVPIWVKKKQKKNAKLGLKNKTRQGTPSFFFLLLSSAAATAAELSPLRSQKVGHSGKIIETYFRHNAAQAQKIKAAKTKLRSLKLFLIQFKFLGVKFWGKDFF